MVLRGTARPLAKEVDRHNIVHMPYRNWCPICGRAKGKEDAHFHRHGEGLSEQVAGLPKISMDSRELESKAAKQDDGDADTNEIASATKVLKIIVMEGEVTGCVFLRKIDSKGPKGT